MNRMEHEQEKPAWLEHRPVEAPSAEFSSRIIAAARALEQIQTLSLWRWLMRSWESSLSFNPVYAVVAVMLLGLFLGIRTPQLGPVTHPENQVSLQAFLYDDGATL